VNEQAVLSLGLSGTDADVPVQTLSYTLVSGPAGLTISGAGQVEWTPGETQGGSNLPVVVRVSDNSGALLSSLGRFDVSVLEVNVAPVLAGVGNQTMDELTPLTLGLSATDTDLPVQSLTYSLVSGPEGLSVSSAGAVAWTPTEAQGPGSYPVVVRVTDNGSPPASAETGFSITVNEVVGNTPPQLAAIGSQAVDETIALALSLSATDIDVPAQTLTYSLVSGPEGLSVNPSGLVEWTPTGEQGPNSYLVRVRVSDDGDPIQSAEREFSITVRELSTTPVLRQYWSFNETNALLQPRLAAGNAVIEVSGGAAVDVLPSTGQGFEAVNANAQLGDLAGTHLRVNNPIGKTNLIRLPTTGVADAVVR